MRGLLGKPVKMVAAGANHSLCLTDGHDLFSCGYNAKGQLGVGDEKSITIWAHVSTLMGKRVSKIYAGGDHSWAVLGKLSFMQMKNNPLFAIISHLLPFA